MPDRLPELLRQKVLLQEHLAWLDREIAAHSAVGQPSAPVPSATAPLRPAPATLPAPAATAAEAERILEQCRAASADIPGNVKKGCFLYLALALALLALGLAAIWFSSRR